MNRACNAKVDGDSGAYTHMDPRTIYRIDCIVFKVRQRIQFSISAPAGHTHARTHAHEHNNEAQKEKKNIKNMYPLG